MNDNLINCVFCSKPQSITKLVKFTPEILKKCKKVLKYRQNKPSIRKSRRTYGNFQLPTDASEGAVYHAQCYKWFTAIKIPTDFFKQPNVIEADIAPKIPAPVDCDIPTTSSAEVANTSVDEPEVANPLEEGYQDEFHPNELDNEDLPLAQCFICERPRKRLRGREVPLTIIKFITLERLKSTATEYNDIKMLKKISSFANGSDIRYQKYCKDQYFRNISRDENREFLIKRKASNNAYTILCKTLEQRIIQKKECFFFDDVKKDINRTGALAIRFHRDHFTLRSSRRKEIDGYF